MSETSMDENEFSAMVRRAQRAKDERQEKAAAARQRRETLLTKAIQTNRVRPDFTPVTESDLADLQAHFERDMMRTLRTHLTTEFVAPDDYEAE